ncbi:MAG: AraC family transcriptional regulator [Solobacterium sp.]|nr:AraC family transcriptional regulator [Solobacterium sp.]
MKSISKLESTCELFYLTGNIPICCYDASDQMMFYYPKTPFYMDGLNRMFLKNTDDKAVILSDRNSLFWGKIHTDTCTIVLGPVSMTVFSERIIHTLMAQFFIGSEYEDELKNILHMIPRLSLFRFSAALRTLHQMCTGRLLSAEEITLSDQIKNGDMVSDYDLQAKVLPVVYENVDTGLALYDISYETEQQMIRNIESGNIKALEKSFSAHDAGKFGALADTTIRSTKNMFIVVIAIASRTAIRNGVSPQVAYNLSDLYIQEIEQTSSFQTLTSIVRNAVIDYSQRIQAVKIPTGISPMVHQAIQYIEQSITQPITVSDVAENADRSVSYFSAEFKKETGMTVSSYITNAKIAEAKRLLKYTDSSLIYISNFLCFSSQSHFQRVFKSVTGETPLSYRRRNHHA